MSTASTPPVKGPLCTFQSLADDLLQLGVKDGDMILLHSSLSSLGWVCGGAEAVMLALLDTTGDAGTLIVPSHSGDNSDPAQWANPPVPEEWHPAIRASMPPYDPRTTRTRGMGVIAETVRTWPNSIRSAHPQTSFTAIGKNAADLVSGHALDCRMEEDSPLARLETAGARVLLLGVSFECCTTFPLAEYRLPSPVESNPFAIRTPEGREWITVQDIAVSDDRFHCIGTDYEKEKPVIEGMVGGASARLFSLPDAVQFAHMDSITPSLVQ